LGIEEAKPNTQRKGAKDRKAREGLTRTLQVSNPITEHYAFCRPLQGDQLPAASETGVTRAVGLATGATFISTT
jgi:hypothetical protein